MIKIKTLSTAVILFAVVTAPVFAQDGGGLGGRLGSESTSSANSEKPDMNSGMSNSENFEMRNSGTTEPGDFAVTGGLSGTGRAWNPTGQVDPGTSNSPVGNAGGE
jgi:hypothetical protein